MIKNILLASPVAEANGLDAAPKPWFVYMIECQDNSIYTGITVNVVARYAMHVNGKGARYTRSRPPKRLLAVIQYPDRSSALRAEYTMKQLTPDGKRKFVAMQTLRS